MNNSILLWLIGISMFFRHPLQIYTLPPLVEEHFNVRLGFFYVILQHLVKNCKGRAIRAGVETRLVPTSEPAFILNFRKRWLAHWSDQAMTLAKPPSDAGCQENQSVSECDQILEAIW